MLKDHLRAILQPKHNLQTTHREGIGPAKSAGVHRSVWIRFPSDAFRAKRSSSPFRWQNTV